MDKPNTSNHTKARQFRLSDSTIAALDRIAARCQVNRTTALKMAVHFFDWKNPKKSQRDY